jgi:hypothetical protein
MSRRAGSRLSAPLLLSTVALVAGVAVLIALASRSAGGGFTYPLDDAYIHMAVARSLAQHGVWGVTPEAFSASSSSLLWPVLLSLGFAMTGPMMFWPLALNALSALGVLLFSERWLSRAGLPASGRSVTLLLLAAALASSVVLGMEHTLHALSALVLLRHAKGSESSKWALGLAAAFATAVRYESLLFVALLVCSLLAERKLRPALAAALGAALPVLSFGTWSLSRGWELLPNPVSQRHAAAGAPLDWEAYGLRLVLNVGSAPALLAATLLLLGLAWHYWRQGSAERRQALLAGLVALSIGAHLCLGATDELARYETYLVVSAVVTLALLLPPVFARARGRSWGFSHAVTGGAVVCVGVLALARAYGVWRLVPTASRNIHDQQLQLTRFVRSLPAGLRVAVNDIGAVSLLGEHPIFDVWALASLPSARFRVELAHAGSIRNLARAQGAQIAAVYAHAFAPSVRDAPPWLEVGQLTIADNVACADATVHFYAADAPSADSARAALRRLFPTLPARTRFRYAPEPTAQGSR